MCTLSFSAILNQVISKCNLIMDCCKNKNISVIMKGKQQRQKGTDSEKGDDEQIWQSQRLFGYARQEDSHQARQYHVARYNCVTSCRVIWTVLELSLRLPLLSVFHSLLRKGFLLKKGTTNFQVSDPVLKPVSKPDTQRERQPQKVTLMWTVYPKQFALFFLKLTCCI